MGNLPHDRSVLDRTLGPLSLLPRLVMGRAGRAHVTLPSVCIGGLRLRSVDLRGDDVHLPIRWPPRVHASRVVIRVVVHQVDLDRWFRSTGLPLRLTLQDGAMTARTGMAGHRFAELDMVLRVAGGRLRVAARHGIMFGMPVLPGAFLPSVTLPLPPFPGNTRVVAMTSAVGALGLTLEMTDVDLPVSSRHAQWVLQGARGQVARVLDDLVGKAVSVPDRSRRTDTETSGASYPRCGRRTSKEELSTGAGTDVQSATCDERLPGA